MMSAARKYYLLDNGAGQPYEIYRGDAAYDLFSSSDLERARKDGSWSDHGVRELVDLWLKGYFDPEDDEITEEQALAYLTQWRSHGGRWPGRE